MSTMQNNNPSSPLNNQGMQQSQQQYQPETVSVRGDSKVMIHSDIARAQGVHQEGRVVGVDSLGNLVIEAPAMRHGASPHRIALKPDQYEVVGVSPEASQSIQQAQQYQQGISNLYIRQAAHEQYQRQQPQQSNVDNFSEVSQSGQAQQAPPSPAPGTMLSKQQSDMLLAQPTGLPQGYSQTPLGSIFHKDPTEAKVQTAAYEAVHSSDPIVKAGNILLTPAATRVQYALEGKDWNTLATQEFIENLNYQKIEGKTDVLTPVAIGIQSPVTLAASALLGGPAISIVGKSAGSAIGATLGVGVVKSGADKVMAGEYSAAASEVIINLALVGTATGAAKSSGALKAPRLESVESASMYSATVKPQSASLTQLTKSKAQTTTRIDRLLGREPKNTYIDVSTEGEIIQIENPSSAKAAYALESDTTTRIYGTGINNKAKTTSLLSSVKVERQQAGTDIIKLQDISPEQSTYVTDALSPSSTSRATTEERLLSNIETEARIEKAYAQSTKGDILQGSIRKGYKNPVSIKIESVGRVTELKDIPPINEPQEIPLYIEPANIQKTPLSKTFTLDSQMQQSQILPASRLPVIEPSIKSASIKQSIDTSKAAANAALYDKAYSPEGDVSFAAATGARPFLTGSMLAESVLASPSLLQPQATSQFQQLSQPIKQQAQTQNSQIDQISRNLQLPSLGIAEISMQSQEIFPELTTTQQQETLQTQRQQPSTVQYTKQLPGFNPPTTPKTKPPTFPVITIPRSRTEAETASSQMHLPSLRLPPLKSKRFKKTIRADPLARAITLFEGKKPREPSVTKELQEKAFVGVPTRQLQQKPTFTYGKKFMNTTDTMAMLRKRKPLR